MYFVKTYLPIKVIMVYLLVLLNNVMNVTFIGRKIFSPLAYSLRLIWVVLLQDGHNLILITVSLLVGKYINKLFVG